MPTGPFVCPRSTQPNVPAPGDVGSLLARHGIDRIDPPTVDSLPGWQGIDRQWRQRVACVPGWQNPDEHAAGLTRPSVSSTLRLVSTNHRSIEVLGDPTRRRIFELLGDAPQPVGDLARQLPVSRPAVSQHLRALREAGLVSHRVSGTRHVYALDPEGVGRLRAWVDRFWDRALTEYQSAAERAAAESKESST